MELEERVAFLEGRVEEQARQGDGLREAMARLETTVQSHLQSIDSRMNAFEERMDRRFEAIDRRFEAIDRRFEAMERRFDALEARVTILDEKFSRYFVWMLGAHVTTLAAVVTALIVR